MSKLKRMLMRFPVDVVIIEKRNEGYVWTFDRATRIVDKEGAESYLLKNRNEEIKPPEYKLLHFMRGGRTILPLFSPTSGQYQPMNIDDPIGLKVDDKDAKFWGIQQIRRTNEIYPKELGFWEKYGNLAMFFMTATLLLMTVLFMRESFVEVANALDSVAAKSVEVAKITSALNPAPPPPPIG